MATKKRTTHNIKLPFSSSFTLDFSTLLCFFSFLNNNNKLLLHLTQTHTDLWIQTTTTTRLKKRREKRNLVVGRGRLEIDSGWAFAKGATRIGRSWLLRGGLLGGRRRSRIGAVDSARWCGYGLPKVLPVLQNLYSWWVSVW
ncbi:unnamed protein product [Vicia faba]|uniref:Transmembrane protein n=1 Tax=Vicia faba TaxID=3906 RepID=A0AAV1BE96_VICFA|nr:unnamed protein product [Vicia faba]